MWGDTFLAIERAHLLRLCAWGVLSVFAGVIVATIAVARQRHDPVARSSLVLQFGIMTALWGVVDLALAALSIHDLHERDVASVIQLGNVVWLNAGFDAGYIGVGATLALCGWLFGRRLGPVGAGLAVVMQGLALLTLDARFILVIGTALAR
jgi:hypothetical protein